MASLVRFGKRLLFSNPDAMERKNVTVRMSGDNGVTWKVKRSVEPGPSGYSDLAVLPDGTILLLYERSNTALTLARFNLKWLRSDPSDRKIK